MPIVNVTLEDVLRAHDTRADAQRRLLRTYRLPLVSFTMNIAYESQEGGGHDGQ